MAVDGDVETDHGELVDRMRELERQVATLHRELEVRDRRIEALESLIEIDGDLDGPAIEIRDEPENPVRQVWVNGFPLGNLTAGMRSDLDDVERRLANVERGEVDPSELVAKCSGPDLEEILPIHRDHQIATSTDPTEHTLRKNQELAARLFPSLLKAGDQVVGHNRRRIT